MAVECGVLHLMQVTLTVNKRNILCFESLSQAV